MCTCICFRNGKSYFGRTLDYNISFNENVVIVPRQFPLKFKKEKEMKSHLGIVGMASIVNGVPLFYDGINEKGVGMAGLHFPDNAFYFDCDAKCVNITPYEFIPFILGQAESVCDAKALISKLNLVNIPFSDDLPLAPLHWIISDKEESITVECVKEGIKVYDNTVEVLTNNPPFDVQMFNLCNYYGLSNKVPSSHFKKGINFNIYCNGLGALGLPGDFSSMSRFVRASFVKEFSKCEEKNNVSQFFHILDSVSQIRGATIMENGDYDITLYTSCCDMENRIYYYKTYNNSQISAIKLDDNLDGEKISKFELATEQQINMVNLAK